MSMSVSLSLMLPPGIVLCDTVGGRGSNDERLTDVAAKEVVLASFPGLLTVQLLIA